MPMNVSSVLASIENLFDEFGQPEQPYSPLLAAAPDPSVFPPFTPDAALGNALRAVGAAFPSAVKLALVNLLPDVSAPRYAGFDDDEVVSIASLAKICAMYAAFQL